jgi:hypothetical protein
MAYPFSLPENMKVINVAAPQVGTAAAVTSDIVSLKNAHKAWIVVNVSPAGGAALLLTPQRCDDVTPTAAAVLVTSVPIWVNGNVAASDTLVRQANAVNYTTVADANSKQIIFEIDPAKLGETAGAVPYDCIRIVTGALPITDFISIDVILAPRYPSSTAASPSALID